MKVRTNVKAGGVIGGGLFEACCSPPLVGADATRRTP